MTDRAARIAGRSWTVFAPLVAGVVLAVVERTVGLGDDGAFVLVALFALAAALAGAGNAVLGRSTAAVVRSALASVAVTEAMLGALIAWFLYALSQRGLS